MRIARLFVMLAVLPVSAAIAQPPPPPAPRPCVLMPRQGQTPQPSTTRPRERCAMLALPRAGRAAR